MVFLSFIRTFVAQKSDKGMKKIVLILLAVVVVLPMKAQQTEMAQQLQQIQLAPESEKKDNSQSFFKHWNVGVSLGTTGVGIDVGMPVCDLLRLRTGFSYMPRFEVPMTFGIQVGEDPAQSASKFARMASVLEDMTGNPVKDHVEMNGRAKMWNWN